MESTTLALLLFRVCLSVTRSTLAKSVADYKFATKGFFLIQAGLFFAGFVFVTLLGGDIHLQVSGFTLIFSVIYAVTLIAAQWFYTYALGCGNISLCSTVYSMGFIFPTISGMLFWNEEISLTKVLGILVVIPAIYISGTGKKKDAVSAASGNNSYVLPIMIAMAASGLLGILQKAQQKSAYAEESAELILISMLIAAVISFITALFTKANPLPINKGIILRACVIGACFGGSNMLNTWLAGMLDSAVFFPILNIGIILLALLVGIVIFKEKPGKKEWCVIPLGIIAILLLSI